MINVIGLGYIGLPTALMLAMNGNQVVGTDINKKLVRKLKQGIVTFEEKGLEDVFQKAEKNIEFKEEYEKTDFYIVTVPTPYNEKTKEIDPKFIIEAVNNILNVCKKETIIVIESTVSPGTIDKYIRPLIKESTFTLNEDIHLAHAPERIIPGNMIAEVVNNPRTIGADKGEIAEKIKAVYSTFCKARITTTTIQTAEMTKVIENTYRAVNIAFANELLKIANYNNLDSKEIIEICNQHPRVDILNPGPGVGGHCIPVDPWFLVGDFPRLTRLTTAALEINESMPDYVIEKINEIATKENITDLSRIGVYGLTYKADIDDVRESPTIQLFNKMKKNFSQPFLSFDPMLKEHIIENQMMAFDQFVDSVDFIVIMTGHTHIKKVVNLIKDKIILDTQGVLDFGYKL
ncbi:nucleotide sugar dehydrogenase [Enterococcus faecium EnGen0263]|uniref:nucleotide sugar dehydrogenase n=1 Tax=Enterococcus faecium TaxID=1352 RepID=UPI00032E374E|nr:nucleotide sugar dehydrogenase [Enterococcus faecium]EOH52844.1 nucleotide sugar dehydrogenase [Enterococcus faecium EnGen0263]